jgi:hypothetical protein
MGSPISFASVAAKAVECVVNGGAPVPNECTIRTRLVSPAAGAAIRRRRSPTAHPLFIAGKDLIER